MTVQLKRAWFIRSKERTRLPTCLPTMPELTLSSTQAAQFPPERTSLSWALKVLNLATPTQTQPGITTEISISSIHHTLQEQSLTKEIMTLSLWQHQPIQMFLRSPMTTAISTCGDWDTLMCRYVTTHWPCIHSLPMILTPSSASDRQMEL